MLVNATFERRVNQMRCYAISLATGQTVLAISIKASTIDDYLRAIGKLYMSAVGFDP